MTRWGSWAAWSREGRPCSAPQATRCPPGPGRRRCGRAAARSAGRRAARSSDCRPPPRQTGTATRRSPGERWRPSASGAGPDAGGGGPPLPPGHDTPQLDGRVVDGHPRSSIRAHADRARETPPTSARPKHDRRRHWASAARPSMRSRSLVTMSQHMKMRQSPMASARGVSTNHLSSSAPPLRSPLLGLALAPLVGLASRLRAYPNRPDCLYVI